MRLRHPVRWLVVPVTVSVLAGLLWFDAPLRARFELSRGALEEVAVNAMKEPGKTISPRRVGLYKAREIIRTKRDVRFITHTCFIDDCGFVYSPDGEPEYITEDSFVHLTGPWYLWERSW